MARAAQSAQRALARSHVAAFGAVALLHALLLACLTSQFVNWSRERAASPVIEAWLTLVSTAQDERAALQELAAAREVDAPRFARPNVASRRRDSDRAKLPAPSVAREPSAAAAAIDWFALTESAAAHALSAEETRSRQARAFDPKRVPGLAEGPKWVRAPPRFRWSHARTNRIERTEDGATIVWLNDRCILVNFVMPFCAVGEIPTHGDLFKDLQRSVEFGDWNDDLAERRANIPP
jgi:hypothetical protein